MSAPFIFIGTHRIREGKLEEFRAGMPDFCRYVEEHEPRLIAFNAYLDEKGEEVAVVQVHPDASSMETHMQIVREHIESAYGTTLEATTSIQIYGELGDDALVMMRQIAGEGVAFTVKQEHLAGFTRSAAQTQSRAA